MHLFTHEDGRHVTVGDARIWCEVRGNPEAPALVLLHGGLGNIEDLGGLAATLGKRFRLIGVDSRGQGKSTLGRAPLTYARLQEDVEAVCGALGVGACDLLGFSDGGIVGLRLAAAGRLKIGRLATIGADWRAPEGRVRDLLARLTPEFWQERFPESVAAYQRLNPEPDFPRLVSAIRALWLDDASYPGDAVRRIGGPLLVIRGDADALFPRANAVELADLVPGALLLNLPYARHAAHEDQPEILGAMIGRFFGPPA